MSSTPSRRPLDHLLVEAAIIRARRTRGPASGLNCIVLRFADGGQEIIEITESLRLQIKRSRDRVACEEQADEIHIGVTERNLLQAVAESKEPITADEAAELAGYPPGTSKVRTAMSSLVKKRCVAKKGGYVVTIIGRQVLGMSGEESRQSGEED